MGYPKLVLLSAPWVGKSFPLTGSEYRIGRHPDMDLVLEHATVSNFHCELKRQENGKYLLVDQGYSTNGTRINGALISNHELEDGDIIQIGEVEILFDGAEGLSSTTSRYPSLNTEIRLINTPGKPKIEKNISPIPGRFQQDRTRAILRWMLLILGSISTILFIIVFALIL